METLAWKVIFLATCKASDDKGRRGAVQQQNGWSCKQTHDEPFQQFGEEFASYPAFWTNSNTAFMWAASFRPQMLYSIKTVYTIKTASDILAASALHTAVPAAPRSA